MKNALVSMLAQVHVNVDSKLAKQGLGSRENLSQQHRFSQNDDVYHQNGR